MQRNGAQAPDEMSPSDDEFRRYPTSSSKRLTSEPTAKPRVNPDREDESMSELATDYVFQTKKIDELEGILTNVITEQSWTISPRKEEGESEFHFHGMSDLGVFSVQFSRALEVNVFEEGHDTGLAFVMATKGSGQLSIGGIDATVSTQSGVLITSRISDKSFDIRMGARLRRSCSTATRSQLIARSFWAGFGR